MHNKTCFNSPVDRSKTMTLMSFDFIWYCGDMGIFADINYGISGAFSVSFVLFNTAIASQGAEGAFRCAEHLHVLVYRSFSVG